MNPDSRAHKTAQAISTHIESSYPLLPLQYGMLLHLLADATSDIDRNQIVVTTPESLDVSSFHRSWQRVLDRHPVLRTAFRCPPGEEPRQEVWTSATVAIRIEDWTDLTIVERDARFREFLCADRRRAIDLQQPPLWTIALFDHGRDGFRFVYSSPHALMDGQSLYIVMEEFFSYYSAATRGDDLELPVPPPFEHFVSWVSSLDRAAAKAYWREKLAALPDRPALLIPAPKDAGAGQGHESLTLSEDLTRRVRRLAKANRVTVALVAKAAWAVLLGRLTGSTDVVFGETRHGRAATIAGASAMVGLFINTIPVRVRLSTETTVEDLLRDLRDDQASTRDYEHTGLSEIQRWIGTEAGSSLFETLFIFDHSSFETPLRRKGGVWEGRRFANHERTSLPITINVHADPVMALSVAYDRSRFDERFMAGVLAYFGEILDGFTRDPAQRICTLNLLPAGERRRLLREWNQTAQPIAADATIPVLFEQQVVATPDRLAVIHEDVRLTYRALAGQVDRLARRLVAKGVGPDVLVGICLGRSEQLIVALLAVVKAGGAYVPLDPEFPADRISLMVADARPLVILTTVEYQGRFADCSSVVLCEDSHAKDAGDEPRPPFWPAPSPEHLAYVIYTSGSTGRPKGVMLTHANVVNCFVGMDRVLGSPSGGTWLAVTSISFDISVLELFYTLTRGFTVVVAGDHAQRSSIGDLITRHGVTHLQCTPSLTKMMLADRRTSQAVGCLQVLMLGGEALPEDLVRRLGNVSGRRILNMYGPTETTIWSTSAVVDAGASRILIGRPIANTETYVVDAHLSPTPAGIPGELLIGGRGVARGYLNADDLTSTKFLPDPFVQAPGRRVYRTGDMVRYTEDGQLEYLGRLDHQVKIHGHRIELGEIESVLRLYGGAADAAVVVRTDLGPEPTLVAYYVSAEGADESHLRRAAADRLPSYMVPHHFVALETFPLTPNGKLDRKALPRPVSENAGRAEELSPPRTPAEAALAAIWRRVLRTDHVGVHDNFFHLGGESVTVVHLSQRIRQELGVEIPLSDLFKHPTLEGMARLTAQSSSSGPGRSKGVWATLDIHRRDAPGTPIIGIHGVDQIFEKLIPLLPAHQPFYTITSHVGFDGRARPYSPCASVEDMAAYYLRELRKAQPSGPYALIGFCLGGLIALEVARRLTSDGEQVAFVGVLNALPQPHANRPQSLRNAGRRSRNTGFVRLYRALRHAAGDLVRSVRREMAYRAYPLLVRAGYSLSPEWLVAQVSKFGMQMVNSYEPRPYAGKIWLYHGNHGPADLRQRWETLALGGLEAHRFEAGHLDLMAEPHVSALAAELRASLDAALTNTRAATAERTPPSVGVPWGARAEPAA